MDLSPATGAAGQDPIPLDSHTVAYSEPMLARLQQTITFSLLTVAAAWLIHWWPEKPLLALAGVTAVAAGHSVILALEFLLMRVLGYPDIVPVPPVRNIIRAWIGETLTAPQIFCWRQPFRASQVQDHFAPAEQVMGQRGAVFVHGFFCNRGLWTPWLKLLSDDGRAFIAVNLEPMFGSIEHYSDIIESAVTQVTQATGMPPVIVCHSMGGLAARAWQRTYGGAGRAHHIITIGSPHGGTWLGRFSRSANGQEMRLASDWVRSLAMYEESHGAMPTTCWYSDCDNIVFPASTATLPYADNRIVHGVAHVRMVFDQEVMAGSLAIIRAI